MNAEAKNAVPEPDEKENRFKVWLTGNIATCQKTIDEFAESVREHPQYALEWSKKAFETAALHKTYHCLKATVENLGFVEGVIAFREDMHKQAVNRAMHPESSCCVPSNFASQCFTSALLNVCRDLELRWGEKRQ